MQKTCLKLLKWEKEAGGGAFKIFRGNFDFLFGVNLS